MTHWILIALIYGQWAGALSLETHYVGIYENKKDCTDAVAKLSDTKFLAKYICVNELPGDKK